MRNRHTSWPTGSGRLPALAVAALLAACSSPATSPASQQPVSSAEGSQGGSAAPVEELNLVVGGIVPITGPQAPFGVWEEAAIELGAIAVNDAAESAGIPLSVTVQIEDEGAGPDVATQAATKLVTGDGATCLVGPNNSADGVAIATNVAVPRTTPIIGVLTTSPALTTLEDDGYYFRTTASDAKQAIVLANFAAEELGGAEGKTINIGARNDNFGSPLADGVAAQWEELGGTVGEMVKWDPNATTYDADAQQLVSGDPAGWVIIDFVTTFQKVAPAIVRTGEWDPARTFVSALQVPNLPELVGEEATEGMRGLAPGAIGNTPLDEQFKEYWNEHIGEDVTLGAGAISAFDGVVLCALAALAGRSTDGPDIRDNLTPVSGPGGDKFDFTQLADAFSALAAGEDIDYEGMYGPIDFDENGDVAAGEYGTIEFIDGVLNITGFVQAP